MNKARRRLGGRSLERKRAPPAEKVYRRGEEKRAQGIQREEAGGIGGPSAKGIYSVGVFERPLGAGRAVAVKEGPSTKHVQQSVII